MRAQKKVAIVVLAILAGGAVSAWADVAATVDPGAISGSSFGAGFSLGWRFFVDKEITITHLGVFAMNDDGSGQFVDGLRGTHTLGIWRVNKTGGLTLMRQVEVSPAGTIEEHHIYVALSEPLTIVPDPVPAVINGIPYYERWLVGVWTPALNQDGLMLVPQTCATLGIVQAGIIRLQNYTYRASSVFTYPWGNTSDSDYYGVNFKYTTPVHAEAGLDVEIYSSQKATTVIDGSATHTPVGVQMQYRWLEDGTVLQDTLNVAEDGTAPLHLSAAPALALGVHTLKLEVTDGVYTSSDTMQLTVVNTPPETQPTPTYQALEIGEDAIIIGASIADFDGDTVSYQWVKDDVVIGSGTVTPPAGGTPVEIDDLVIPAGDPRFVMGDNVVQFVVSDGVNPAETKTVTVKMQDTTAPTLAPTPSTAMLWPPNHAMVPVTVWANAVHNGAGVITLSASVQSSEPLDTAGDGSTEEDCIVTSIDQMEGKVLVQLRAERSGTGGGRVYTITVTASDAWGNHTTATVDVRVPHDKKKR